MVDRDGARGHISTWCIANVQGRCGQKWHVAKCWCFVLVKCGAVSQRCLVKIGMNIKTFYDFYDIIVFFIVSDCALNSTWRLYFDFVLLKMVFVSVPGSASQAVAHPYSGGNSQNGGLDHGDFEVSAVCQGRWLVLLGIRLPAVCTIWWLKGMMSKIIPTYSW